MSQFPAIMTNIITFIFKYPGCHVIVFSYIFFIGAGYGKGRKKSEIQQLYEELEACGKRLMEYAESFVLYFA